MAPRIWDRFLTPLDQEVFAAAGYGTSAGFGERPAPPDGLDPNSIVAEVAPLPQDILIAKQKSSAFFGTNLPSDLHAKYADVIPARDVLAFVGNLPTDLFPGRLPCGG